METISNEIEEILNHANYSEKDKIDKLLEVDCLLYVNMGCDSKKCEKAETKRASRKIYTAIKGLNKDLGTQFLKHMDA